MKILSPILRAVAYAAIVYLLGFRIDWLGALFHVSDAWLNILAPWPTLVIELSVGVAVVIATGIMAAIERRSILSYGFTPSRSALPLYARGVVLAVVAAGCIAVLMVLFGGMQIHGFNLHGSEWLSYPLAWAIAMVAVGFSEEAAFRGYLLVALRRGIGFWPAAIVSSLLFVWAHTSKPGENLVDYSAIFVFGMWGCFTFWKTGSLWLMAGFHAAFDFMQFVVIGTPNGSERPVGTMLDVTFNGPAWVNGGVNGTEASYFIFPALALLFVYIARRFRNTAELDALRFSTTRS